MKRLLVDMDGVLCNFLPYFLSRLNDLYDIDMKVEDVLEWDISESVQRKYPEANLSKSKVYKPLSEEGFFEQLEPYQNGIEVLQEFVESGKFEVVIVTACLRGHEEKLKWLGRNLRFPYKVVFTEDKYLVRGDYFIDDKPSNLKSWSDSNPAKTTICMDHLYNKDWFGNRCANWDSVRTFIQLLNESYYGRCVT